MPDPTRPPSVYDLEIKDAQIIFSAVWDDLIEKYGRDKLRFPREVIWLGGAPGAGKGTNTPFIAKARDITAPPVVISGLLNSPQAVALKNAGRLSGDREVCGLLFEELLKPIYHDGVIVDGFPRTQVQVECVKLFYHAMLALHDQYRATPLAKEFRKPAFRIALLYVGEEVSVQRQLKRGREIKEHNEQVRKTGVGQLLEDPRPTDLDPVLCRSRYQTFNSTFAALKTLSQIFHFYFIDAEGELAEVQANILREFNYQSKLELSQEVFDRIGNIPIADDLARHARQELVERLEGYEENNPGLFARIVELIKEKMIPIVRAHATTGHARINTEDGLLDDPEAIRMMIDVFSERGFHASVDIHRVEIPARVDPKTWEISCRTKKVYRIEINYQPSEIRRGH